MKKIRTPVFTSILLFLAFSVADASPRQEVIAGPITGQVLKVLDGDTVAVRMHVWIGEEIETSVRINGIDAPEIHGKCDKERSMAEAAKQEMISLTTSPIRIYNIRLEKYAGRVLAEAETQDGVNIGKHMLEKGLARPYHGEKRKPWCNVN